jgi:RNA polymerase primary sigma factor
LSRRYPKDSCLSRYLSEISQYRVLSKEEEVALAKKVRSGSRSVNRLVESNLSFVVKIANEYRTMGLAFEDLLNEGNIGLIEAAQRYDHRKGTKFITYAIWWIRKAILKALAEQATLVRVPNYQLKKVREIREMERNLSRSLGRRPRRDEISAKMDSPVSKLDEILQIKVREVSLDEKVGEERDTPISEYLVDVTSVNPEDEFIRNEGTELIRTALFTLTDQEKTVVANRFGLKGRRTMTLKEIGEQMGLSRERIRQIECQAKRKLRKIFTNQRAVASPLKQIRPKKKLPPHRDVAPADAVGSRK